MNRLLTEYTLYVSNNTIHMSKKKDKHGNYFRSFFKFGHLPKISFNTPYIIIFKKKPSFMIKKGPYELILYLDTLKLMYESVKKRPNPPCIQRNYKKIDNFLKLIREEVRKRGFCFAKIEELSPIMVGWDKNITFHSKYCMKHVTRYMFSPKHITELRKKYIGKQKDIDTVIDINCNAGNASYGLLPFSNNAIFIGIDKNKETLKHYKLLPHSIIVNKDPVMVYNNVLKLVKKNIANGKIIHIHISPYVKQRTYDVKIYITKKYKKLINMYIKLLFECLQLNPTNIYFSIVVHHSIINEITATNANFKGISNATDYGCPSKRKNGWILYDKHHLQNYSLYI